MPCDRSHHGCDRPPSGPRAVRGRDCEISSAPSRCRSSNVVNKQFDGGDYPEVACAAPSTAIGLPAIRERQRKGEPDGRLIGVGFSIFCEQGAMGTAVLAAWGRPVVPGYEQATVRLTADGDLEIRVGTHSHGQGHETTLAQIAHEILGVDFDRIKVLQGDTLYSPFSTGTWASRSIVMAGGAVAQASRAAGRADQTHRRVAAANRSRPTCVSRTAASSGEGRASRCARSRVPGTCSRSTCPPTSIQAGWKSPAATVRRATWEHSATPVPRGAGRGRSRHRADRNSRLRRGRRRRQARQSDDRRRAGAGRRRARHRNVPAGSSAVRRAGPAVGVHHARLPSARARPKFRISASCTWKRPRRTPNSA